MSQGEGIRCAKAMTRILEKEGVKYVFGHPGEQILPFYEALKNSNLEHILMRHEQGAAHAADGYARASGGMGVCIAAAGPGALNLVMGVATAYKDSVPLLVITADVSTKLKGKNTFQDVKQLDVFKPITLKSFDIKSPEDGVLKLKKAIKILKTDKTGPIHLNIPKDVLTADLDKSLLGTESSSPNLELFKLQEVFNLLEKSDKLLIIAGAGVIWSGAADKIRKFALENEVPVATTYHARGIIPEDHPLALGLIGLRGTDAANYAGKNADVVLAVGCRLSERTIVGLGNAVLIHVNMDGNVLQGEFKIKADAGEFMDQIQRVKLKSTVEWIKEVQNHNSHHNINTDYPGVPMKPQRAINEILNASKDVIIVNDAGSHTTWVNFLRTVQEPCSLLFSGGFGPMGYGLPASVGASLARPEKNILLVVGDGGFQMTIQELAVISELKLPVLIAVINNQELGIIKQWQELFYDGPYQVALENPDFVPLAQAYHIEGQQINNPEQISDIVEKVLKLKKPYLLEFVVDRKEGIPLPEVSK
ncbi:MAG TPA: thiamine pyrophosphate-binding protein [Methanobacteriaceae archaeon]|nr:thiamine pyrophosphate-binding protein [Methanobacteriaceae archaeon]